MCLNPPNYGPPEYGEPYIKMTEEVNIKMKALAEHNWRTRQSFEWDIFWFKAFIIIAFIGFIIWLLSSFGAFNYATHSSTTNSHANISSISSSPSTSGQGKAKQKGSGDEGEDEEKRQGSLINPVSPFGWFSPFNTSL